MTAWPLSILYLTKGTRLLSLSSNHNEQEKFPTGIVPMHRSLGHPPRSWVTHGRRLRSGETGHQSPQSHQKPPGLSASTPLSLRLWLHYISVCKYSTWGLIDYFLWVYIIWSQGNRTMHWQRTCSNDLKKKKNCDSQPDRDQQIFGSILQDHSLVTL